MANTNDEFPRFDPIHEDPARPSTGSNTRAHPPAPTRQDSSISSTGRSRGNTGSSSFLANTARKFSTSGMPLGFFQASGQVVSSAPTLKDIQSGNLDGNGWSGVGQRRNSVAWKANDGTVLEEIERDLARGGNGLGDISEAGAGADDGLRRTDTRLSQKMVRRYSVVPEGQIPEARAVNSSTEKSPEKQVATVPPPFPTESEISSNQDTAHSDSVSNGKGGAIPAHDPTVPYPNGYQFPPKHTKSQSFRIAMIAYWGFLKTWFGFLLTVYALNIVAWGGMLFIVLIGGANKYMCHPKVIPCSSKDSVKNIWIENDSQILNALFCVTGLGLIPWRFRDLYYLLQWRLRKNILGLRRLAGINRDWVRLPRSELLDPLWDPKTMDPPAGFDEITFAYPIEKCSDPPLTGERAPETKLWKLDFYIWCYVWNTIFQILLCFVMWNYNRHTRPSWTTGCIIPVACIVAAAGGIVTFQEGKKVKRVEGVPVSADDLEILRVMREREKGISGGEEGRIDEEVPQFHEVKETSHEERKSTEEGPMGESN